MSFRAQKIISRALALLLTAGAMIACTPLAQAALEWPTKSFHGQTLPLQKTLTVAFAFKNTGRAPVSIRDLQTNCDCLEAGADKIVYQPGEAGVITATFTVGERYGTYDRAVTLVTDDAASPHRLSVRIDVPDPATFSPRTLEWKIGADAREHATDLVVADGVSLDFAEVMASNQSFRARLETLERGRRYRVHVTPASTAEIANAAVRVKAKLPDGEEVVVSTYANVR